ncbi:hypothetical protein FHL15_006707 [Xylaria flabelliformis]|uniref:Uncharacterized protein n=1 Tax=Xylaria flabelliformis TaxID=2512241 RepID=A0A553HWK9_9PEZI|nr:hypothetical protein FHL15_006707 [Xylaria flabelliformis]
MMEDVAHRKAIDFLHSRCAAAVGQRSLRNHASTLVTEYAALQVDTSKLPKRLVLITHSLVGLVAKKALIVSAESAYDGHRAPDQHIVGLLFIGTPHRGSDLAGYITIMARVLKLTGKRISDVIMCKNRSTIVSAKNSPGETGNSQIWAKWLKILAFPEMNSRENSIPTATADTYIDAKDEQVLGGPNLLNLFENTLRNALEVMPVWLFVDALDECRNEMGDPDDETEEVRDEELKILTEVENAADIKAFVERELHDGIAESEEEVTVRLQNAIAQNALGSFQWTKLITSKALSMHRTGKSTTQIIRQIQTAPRQLSTTLDIWPQKLYLIHQSVKDYLFDKGFAFLDGNKKSRESLTSDAHLCMAYIYAVLYTMTDVIIGLRRVESSYDANALLDTMRFAARNLELLYDFFELVHKRRLPYYRYWLEGINIHNIRSVAHRVAQTHMCTLLEPRICDAVALFVEANEECDTSFKFTDAAYYGSTKTFKELLKRQVAGNVTRNSNYGLPVFQQPIFEETWKPWRELPSNWNYDTLINRGIITRSMMDYHREKLESKKRLFHSSESAGINLLGNAGQLRLRGS